MKAALVVAAGIFFLVFITQGAVLLTIPALLFGLACVKVVEFLGKHQSDHNR